VLVTFSTYVLLPRLASLRREDGQATFDVLVFVGPPGRGPSDADTDSLPIMTVERVGTAFLRTSDLRLEVDRYLVTSDLGESELYARGDEFLALHAGDSDDPLWVYRSDFFPDGIEVVNAAPLP